MKKYPCIGVTFKIGGTNVGYMDTFSPVGFVPPILNVTPIHGYFFNGEETGSADRAGGLTCEIFLQTVVRLEHLAQRKARKAPPAFSGTLRAFRAFPACHAP